MNDAAISNALSTSYMLVTLTTRQAPMTIGDLDQTRKVEMDTGAKKGTTRVVNTIWGNRIDDIKAIHAEMSAARGTHNRYTVPWMPSGTRTKATPGLLANTRFMDYVREMNAHKAAITTLLDKLEPHYAQVCADAKASLGTMGPRLQHPTFDQLRERVGISFVYDAVPQPGDMANLTLPAGIVARLNDIHTQQADKALKLAIKSAWEQALVPLSTLVNNCSKEKGRLYDSLITNLRQVVDAFGAFNITKDPEMEKVRQDLLAICVRYPVDEMRKSATTRKEAAEAAKASLAKVEDVLANLPW